MGGGSWTPQDWNRVSSSTIRGKSASQIYSSTTVKKDFDPKGVAVRESCDSAIITTATKKITALA